MKAEASSYDVVGVLVPLWYSEPAEVALSVSAGLSEETLRLSDSALVDELSAKESRSHRESPSSAEDRSLSEGGCPVKSERVDGRERASRSGWRRTMKSVSLRGPCVHIVSSSSMENWERGLLLSVSYSLSDMAVGGRRIRL